MKVSRLTLRQFTAFEDATFEFASGVNVLLGENGIGKSHVLELVYALEEAVRRNELRKNLQHRLAWLTTEVLLADLLVTREQRLPGLDVHSLADRD